MSFSRFGNYDDDREFPELDCGRWEANVKRTIAGKRGQKALAELEEALLAMPDKRLIAGGLCELTEVGYGPTVMMAEFCVIGAYAAYKGRRPEELADYIKEWPDHETAQLGKELGMSFTLAWHVGELNDEQYGEPMLTPESRYEEMLAWVQQARATSHA